MTDARDAILSADLASTGGANRAVIWQVFAKHGMGYSARGIDGDFFAGTVHDAAYDQPPDLQTLKNPSITSNPLSVATAMGETYAYKVAAMNPNDGPLSLALTSGPSGMTLDSSSGSIGWTAGFTTQRVKVAVTDGKGGKVEHGYLLPVVTHLSDAVPVTIGGDKGSNGVATFTVAAGTQVLQVTMAAGIGNADLQVTDPNGVWSYSRQSFSPDTLTFANPAAGLWRILVTGYTYYGWTPLMAASVALFAEFRYHCEQSEWTAGQ